MVLVNETNWLVLVFEPVFSSCLMMSVKCFRVVPAMRFFHMAYIPCISSSTIFLRSVMEKPFLCKMLG